VREGTLDIPGVRYLDVSQRLGHALCILAVVARGGRFAPAHGAILLELEDHALEGVGLAAGDGEGALSVHRHGPDPLLQDELSSLSPTAAF
jgi:hypothetical protein